MPVEDRSSTSCCVCRAISARSSSPKVYRGLGIDDRAFRDLPVALPA
ncbi:hypothetical protein [Agromyces sp. SYSU T00194]